MVRLLGLKMLRALARRKATLDEIAHCVREDPKMALMFARPLTDDQIATGSESNFSPIL